MTTALHRNTTTHPVELADGRLLPPGEDADIDPKDPVHQHLLKTGQIGRLQSPKDPAPDPDPPAHPAKADTTKAGG